MQASQSFFGSQCPFTHKNPGVLPRWPFRRKKIERKDWMYGETPGEIVKWCTRWCLLYVLLVFVHLQYSNLVYPELDACQFCTYAMTCNMLLDFLWFIIEFPTAKNPHVYPDYFLIGALLKFLIVPCITRSWYDCPKSQHHSLYQPMVSLRSSWSAKNLFALAARSEGAGERLLGNRWARASIKRSSNA